jgi:hypothetical protein
MMYCEYCSQKIPDDSRFCEHCGKPLNIHQKTGAKSPIATPQDQGFLGALFKRPAQKPLYPDYSRIVFWVREKYGSRFSPQRDETMVQRQLESILTEEKVRDIPADALKGFQAFINRQQNEMLIRRQR